MIISRNKYNQKEYELAEKLSSELNVSKEVALLLVNHEITNKDQAQKFLSPKYEDMHSPFLMKNMRSAVFRIFKAIEKKQRIIIYCDYDVDGTTACSILYLYFKSIDVDVEYYTPNRHLEGYGLNDNAVEEIISKNIDLVITVDCGITNVSQCKTLIENNIDVIIADHHECGDKIPDTPYILNPKQSDCNYPYKYLSGAGISFKMVQGLNMDEAINYIDYAAVGTISDIVPLTGENRVIAKLGLEKMNNDISCGLNLIKQYAVAGNKKIDEFHVGFGIGPRINAAGRMDSAHAALDVLLATKETEKTRKAAYSLNELNEQRKSISEKTFKECENIINGENLLKEQGAIFLKGDWDMGIVGICASRLCAKYFRPVLVFANDGETAVCSARSVEGLDIHQILSGFEHYYIKFGGHTMAAGLTIKAEDFDNLKKDVNEYIRGNYDQSFLIPKYVYDIEINPNNFDISLVKQLEKLAPYGQDNPKPKLLFKGVDLEQKIYFGKNDKNHLKYNIKSGDGYFQALKFFFNKDDVFVNRGNVIVTSTINDYNNKAEVIIDHIEKADIDSCSDRAFSVVSAINDMESCNDFDGEVYDMNHVADIISDYIENNCFGTCIVINNAHQLKTVLNNEKIIELLEKSKLKFRSDGQYNIPVNSIIYSTEFENMIKAYENVVFIGNPNLENEVCKKFVTKELILEYNSASKDYFLDERQMKKFFIEYRRYSTEKIKFNSVSEFYHIIASACGINMKKTIFALLSLKQLDLIDLQKSDTIMCKIIKQSQKKELDDSSIYSAVKKLKENG